MPTYAAPVEHVMFLLRDVLGYERYANLPGFSDAPLDVVEPVLQEAARFCGEVIAPLNQVGDREGCIRHPDGRVTTATGFREAYRQYAEAGWVGLAADPAQGGGGLPYTLAAVLNEFVSSANMAWGMYPGLTQGAIAALYLHGSDEQKAVYLTKLVSGEWVGHHEPHRAAVRHRSRPDQARKAVPAADGSYRITGQKIFISAGEHDLTANIVHLVLARIEGAPPGTKGLSLFVVPKFIPDAGRQPGGAQRRVLRLAGAQDGHPRQCHLRHELRRGDRLAGGRGGQGLARHVHHDERGPAWRCRAGSRHFRGRLPERGRSMRATGCRAAPFRAPRPRTASPTRSSFIPISAASS